MASYIKLWTSIRYEPWWKELGANGRGALVEMLLMVKEQRDNGHLVVNSASNLARSLSINRHTLAKIVAILTNAGAVTLVQHDQALYHLHFVKYLKWQKMDAKTAVQLDQAPRYEMPDRAEQSRLEQTIAEASPSELALANKKIKKKKSIQKESWLIKAADLFCRLWKEFPDNNGSDYSVNYPKHGGMLKPIRDFYGDEGLMKIIEWWFQTSDPYLEGKARTIEFMVARKGQIVADLGLKKQEN